jgi:D-amino peptidase
LQNRRTFPSVPGAGRSAAPSAGETTAIASGASARETGNWRDVIEMQVLVSVDMEGIAGVVHGNDIKPGHPEYERNRQLLTAEANAAVRGVHAYQAGARVLITEAHADFRNLLPEKLDRRAELLRGTPKPYGMMAGLAEDIDAVLFIGYHGKAGTARSVMAHTISGRVIADVRCNGRSLGELGLNTALAAHSGVPPVLVTGDDTVAAEAADVAPGMHAVVVKRALGAQAAALLHPDEACNSIEQEVPKALADRDGVQALHFDGPVLLEVQVLRPEMTEHALLIPGIERPDGCTLRYPAPDFPTAYQVTELVAMLGAI